MTWTFIEGSSTSRADGVPLIVGPLSEERGGVTTIAVAYDVADVSEDRCVLVEFTGVIAWLVRSDVAAVRDGSQPTGPVDDATLGIDVPTGIASSTTSPLIALVAPGATSGGGEIRHYRVVLDHIARLDVIGRGHRVTPFRRGGDSLRDAAERAAREG